MSPHGSHRPLPTASALEDLQKAVEGAADRRALPQQTRQVYGTWIFGFVCWCLRNPPNRVTPDRIESFRRNLREDTSAAPVDQRRALDALAFFFGEVDIEELNIQTARLDQDGFDEDLPFFSYNQISEQDTSPLSPARKPAPIDVHTTPSEVRSAQYDASLEPPERI